MSPRLGSHKMKSNLNKFFLLLNTDTKKGNPPKTAVSQPLWAPLLVFDHLPDEIFFFLIPN